MKYKKIGNKYFVRLQRGEKVIETLTNFLFKKRVFAAQIVAVGAFSHATLGYFSVKKRKYFYKKFKDVEATAIIGNVSSLNGKSFIHAHAVLGRHDFTSAAGHLKEATVSATFEGVITASKTRIKRKLDPVTGLNLWDV